MTINFKTPEIKELKPRILVLGVGGAGGNAINKMIESGLQGVEFVAVNTDAQDLINNTAGGKIQLGQNLTKGLGAGAKHEIGQAAAEESLNDIIDYIKGSHLVINRKIKNGLMFRDQKKQRYIFALPYEGNLLLGTTEERVSTPEDKEILDSEDNYHLESINIYIHRPINKDEIIESYAGVRPLIKSKAKDFHSSSRDFYIQKDKNLLSLFGGKWTTAPSIARNIVRIVNNE